ncbi:MAG: hypothetical protein V8S93_07700 [Lachnospiraceae bacterium]
MELISDYDVIHLDIQWCCTDAGSPNNFDEFTMLDAKAFAPYIVV